MMDFTLIWLGNVLVGSVIGSIIGIAVAHWLIIPVLRRILDGKDA